MRGILFGITLVAATAATLSAQDMIAVDNDGGVYLVDSATGSGTFLASSAAATANAMARRSDGKIFVAGEVSGVPLPIYEIDVVTGAATQVATVPVEDVRGLAFDPADVLYAVVDRNTTGFDFDDLYVFDLAAGTATLVGPTNLKGVQALTWGVDSFYAWDCGSGGGTGLGLITIDPATGTANDVDPSVPGTCADVQSLTMSKTGVLYGIRDELFTVDTSTGSLTLVGSGGFFDVRGAEFTDVSAPTLYCTAKATSIAGCLPLLSAPSGTASLTAGAGSYDVSCGPLPGGPNFGALTYTTMGPLAVPLQNAFGWQCIPTGVGYVVMTPPLVSGGTVGACSGAYTFDFGAYLAGPHGDPNLTAGATVDLQILYRDPANVGTANLSSALGLVLAP